MCVCVYVCVCVCVCVYTYDNSEVATKTIPKKKKCKTKWLSEEVLQTVEKRREVKGKGERERYTQPNAEI